MHLVDTNIWLERLLAQERSDEVGQFLASIPSSELAMTDFTFHTIGVILSRLGQLELFVRFTEDVLVGAQVSVLSLTPEDMRRLAEISQMHQLDFDDAYQYLTAQKHDLTLVTFDKHFDSTPLAGKTPAQVLADV